MSGSDLQAQLEKLISQKYPYQKLPQQLKQNVSHGDWEKQVYRYSVRNQLRWRSNVVRMVVHDEKRYYEDLVKFSLENLMLYPYHLSDVLVKGLRITPFQFYRQMLHNIVLKEKSYDSLPNFTAADCLRLLGIGRNQFIDIMNSSRATGFFMKGFGKKREALIDDLLPKQSIDISIEHWWFVHVGYVREDDIKACTRAEHQTIDQLIDYGPALAIELNREVVHSLYKKGLLYLRVPVTDTDCISVPPLEGFVMNRITGDYFETLLYKIFVAVDEHTTIAELANVLQISLPLVKNAVSAYCRLGFAKKIGAESIPEAAKVHPSWSSVLPALALAGDQIVAAAGDTRMSRMQSSGHVRRLGFIFDSTLTAFLMMGNLSSGLKNHAVTMFEVGKLSDETLDSFVAELSKVGGVAEGEAQRYFDHAIILRNTLMFLRHNPDLSSGSEPLGLDLLRLESLYSLDAATRCRVLAKNYELLISMAPLSTEARSLSSCQPGHFGPPIPEANSPWFKLWLYTRLGSGPPSFLLRRGQRLSRLPPALQRCSQVMLTAWDHDGSILPAAGCLLAVNEALAHSPVLLQAYSLYPEHKIMFVPFPAHKSGATGYISTDGSSDNQKEDQRSIRRSNRLYSQPLIQRLGQHVNLDANCGYITLLRLKGLNATPQKGSGEEDKESQDMAAEWVVFDVHFGIPLFDLDINKMVCETISERGLFKSEALQAQSTASRLLVLDLLDFIAQNIDMAPETAITGTFTPLPTHSLQFVDGLLMSFTDT